MHNQRKRQEEGRRKKEEVEVDELNAFNTNYMSRPAQYNYIIYSPEDCLLTSIRNKGTLGGG